MISITLAAGMGKRMEEMCLDKPKVMIDFLGKTLLQRQKNLFSHKKIKHYIVCGYQADAIDFPHSNRVENKKFSTTNMVYSLLCAKDIFKENEDVIVSYGDIIFQNEVLEKLLNENNGDIQICADLNFLKLWTARMENPIEDLESFDISDAGYVSNIGNKLSKRSTPYAQYIGLFKIKSHFIRRFIEAYENLLADDIKYQNLAMTHFLQKLIDLKAKIAPVYINGGWLEFDTIQDFNRYSEMHTKGTLGSYYVD